MILDRAAMAHRSGNVNLKVWPKYVLPYWRVHFHRSVLYFPFTHHHGPFLLIFTKEVTWVHEMEIETGHSTDLGSFFNELGHGESRDRNRGWKVQKC